LYEALQKPSGAAFVSYPFGKAELILSVLDYSLNTKETQQFWKSLFTVMNVNHSQNENTDTPEKQKRGHDLLMDGPVNQKNTYVIRLFVSFLFVYF
jgi:hypothetical protein